MRKAKSNILVTGGTGFIGSNLVKRLCMNENDHVTIFARNPSHIFLKNLKIKIIQGDIRNYNSVLMAVKGSDYVYHLAASSLNTLREKGTIFGVNVDGTENVMKSCLNSHVKKVVHVSSCSALGFTKKASIKLNENNFLDFKDQVYGQSKKLGEDTVQEYVAKGLNATIVLPPYVVGPGEIDTSRYTIFQSISRNRVKFAYPGGGGTVAVEDLVEGIMLAMKKGRPGQRYILSNTNINFIDRYNMIADILKRPRINFVLPRWTYYPLYLLGAVWSKISNKPIIDTETVRWSYNYRYYDSSKARKELGWNPKIPIKESFRRAINYYRKIGALS